MALPIVIAGVSALATGAAAKRAYDKDKEPALPPRRAILPSPELQRSLINSGRGPIRPYTPPPPVAREATFGDRVKDFAITDVGRGVLGAARGITGLANLPFAAAGAAPLEPVERKLAEWGEYLKKGYSDERQLEQADFEQSLANAAGQGVGAQIKAAASAAVRNPAVGFGMVPEIGLGMYGGSKLGSLAIKGRPLLAAAAGEGAIAAGYGSAAIGAETDQEQNRLWAVPAGAATAGITFAGGSLVNRMAQSGSRPIRRAGEILAASDPETRIAGGARVPAPAKLYERVPAGFLREGLLEELPQSAQEQMFQNVGTDRPLMEGVGTEATIGAILGGVMGGAFNLPGASEQQKLDYYADSTPKPQTVSKSAWEEVKARISGRMETPARDDADEPTVIRTKADAEIMFAQTNRLGAKGAAALRETDWYRQLQDFYVPENDPLEGVERPDNVSEERWNTLRQKASTEGVSEDSGGIRSTEQADAVFKAFGIKGAAAKALRGTAWYQELAAAEQTETEQTTSEEEAPPEAAAESEQPAPAKPQTKAKAKAQPAEEAFDPDDMPETQPYLNDDLDPEEMSRELDAMLEPEEDEGGEPLRQAAPRRPQQKASAPAQRVSQAKGLVAALSGWLTQDMSRDSRSSSKAFRTMARRAASVLERLGKPTGRAGNAIGLVEEAHTLARRLEKASNNLSKVRRGEFVDFERGKPKIKQIVPENAQETSVAEGLADSRGGIEGQERVADQRATEYEKIAKRLAKVYAELERLLGGKKGNREIGRKALLDAMAYSKLVQFNQSQKMVPGMRLNSETSEMVRFSQYYSRYIEGLLGSHSMRDMPTRIENKLAKRLSQVPNLPSQLERVSRGEMAQPQSKAAVMRRSPLRRILMHYRTTMASPLGQRLANQLDLILERMDRMAGGEAVKLVFVNNQLYGKNSARGSFLVSPGKKKLGTITLYRSGQNPITVIHETLHAVTAALLLDSSYNSPAKRNLLALTKFVLEKYRADKAALSEEELAGEYGLPHDILSTLDSLNAERAAAEMLTYALTDSTFQQWLANEMYTGPALEQETTVWNALVVFIKRMLRIHNVPNSVMSRVLTSSSSLMREGFEAPETLLQALPDDKPRTPLADEVEPETASEPLNAKASRAEQRKAKSEQRTRARRETDRRNEDYAEQRRTSQANEANKAEQEQAKVVEEQLKKIAAQQGTTAIEARRVARRRGVLRSIDQAGAAIANAMMPSMRDPVHGGMISGFENVMNARLGQAGRAITDWATSGDSPIHIAATKMMVGLVDDFGVPEKFLPIRFAYQAALHNGRHLAIKAAENLRTLDEAGQQVLLDYLTVRVEGRKPDRAALAEKLGENGDRKLQYIEDIVDGMEQTLVSLQGLGLLDKKYLDETGRPDLSRVLDITTNSKLKLGSSQRVGSLAYNASAYRRNNVIEMATTPEVYNAQGLLLEQGDGLGSKYRRALNADGETVYVDSSISDATMDALDLAYDLDYPRPLTMRRYDSKTDTAEFARFKTWEERRSGRLVAQVVPSLLTQFNDLNRLLSGNRLIGEMAAQNQLLLENSATEGAAYIRNEPPEDAPENRQLHMESAKDIKTLRKQARTPGTWVKIPEKGTEGLEQSHWAPLAGQWVAGPVYASLEDYHDSSPIVNSEVFNTSLRVWKKYKTAWSPITHMQNVAGNFVLMYMNDIGMDTVRYTAKLMMYEVAEKAAIKAWGPLSKKDRAILNEFLTSGATLSQFSDADFDQDTVDTMVRWINKQDSDAKAPRSVLSGLMSMQDWMAKATKTYRHVDDALLSVYSNTDNVFRMAAYVEYVQNAMEREPNATPERILEIKQSAAKHAADSFVNYQISAPWVRFARGTFTPFLAWTYRIIPLMAKLMITKPWKAGTMLSALYAMNALSYMLLGGDADEDEERRVLDEYMQTNPFGIPGIPNYVRLPFGTGDDAVFLALGQMIPASTLWETQSVGTPRSLVPSGPLFSLAWAAINNDPFLGTEIRHEADSPTTRWADTIKYVSGQLAPNIATNTGRLIDKHFIDGGALGPLGNEPSMYVDLLRWTGFNLREVNLPEQNVKFAQRLERLKYETSVAINQAQQDYYRRGDPDEEAIRRTVESLHARYAEKLNTLLEGDY